MCAIDIFTVGGLCIDLVKPACRRNYEIQQPLQTQRCESPQSHERAFAVRIKAVKEMLTVRRTFYMRVFKTGGSKCL